MPELNINNQTTFTQIANTFHRTGNAGKDAKHIRFSDGDQLYTSKDASTANAAKKTGALFSKLGFSKLEEYGQKRLDDRAAKQHDGAVKVMHAIDHQFGNGYAVQLFGRFQLQHGRDLTQGITRADITMLQQMIASDRAPVGMTIGNNGLIGGQMVVNNTLQGPSMQQLVNQKGTHFANQIDRNDAQAHQVGGQWICDKFKADAPRMQMTIPLANGNFNTQGQDIATTVANLRTFAGNDNAVSVLTSVMHQNLLAPLHMNMSTANQAAVNFKFPNSHDEVTVTTAQGKITERAKQYGNCEWTLSKTAQGDFQIQIDWPLYAIGLKTQGREIDFQFPETNGAIRAMHTTTWVIDANAAAQGNLVLNITNPLTIDFEGQLA